MLGHPRRPTAPTLRTKQLNLSEDKSKDFSRHADFARGRDHTKCSSKEGKDRMQLKISMRGKVRKIKEQRQQDKERKRDSY